MTRFYNFLAAASVILTPVALMAALGWAVYQAILVETGVAWLAIISGLATAAAAETIGIVAGETTLWFHSRADRRWMTAAAILVLYVLFGLVTLWGSPLALLPVLAGAVYVLIGLRAQAQRETAAEDAQATEDRQWEREKYRIQQADATAVKLARVSVLAQSQHAAAPASSPASIQPAISQHVCEDCGQSFGSVQAINAHRRFCRGVVSQNGVAH